MKDFLCSLIIAFSFFTAIPLPRIEWTGPRIKFIPIFMPLVGLGIGSVAFGLYSLLARWDISTFTGAVLMALFYLVITGGLHLDGLMDTADAYFSGKSKESKLEIMKDSRVGAFGVMVLVSLLLLKIACFYEILAKGQNMAVLLLFIPVLSRIGQAFILCHFPYAKKDGLAVIFKGAGRPFTSIVLSFYLLLTTGLIYILIGLRALLLPLGLLIFTLFYYFSTQKNFGGITGDIVGAFVELVELFMLIILILL